MKNKQGIYLYKMLSNVVPIVGRLIVLLGAFFILGGCVSTVDAHSDQSSLLPSAPQSSIRELKNAFENVTDVGTKTSPSSYELSEAVEPIILSCCADRETAIDLLKRSGFKVNDPRPYTKANVADVPYQESIFAEKEGMRLLYVWITHRVIIYIRDNKIVDVKAFSFSDGL